MSAGTGIRHSEFNPSPTEPVHLFQIWLLPIRKELAAQLRAEAVQRAEKHNRLRLVARWDGREGALTIHQDADLYLATLDEGVRVAHSLRPGRSAWLQVLKGAVRVNGTPLNNSDGVAVTQESALAVEATTEAAEILLFDLA